MASIIRATSRRDVLKIAGVGGACALVGARSGRAATKNLSFMHESSFIQTYDDFFKKTLVPEYAKATGRNDPLAVSGGGTYAKRLPRAIAFGMWFPGKPYPGHGADERISLDDLQAGLDVLLVALRDLAEGPPVGHPFTR